MGNGRLQIGIGLGDATVFNPLPAVQQFNGLLAQRRAEQDAKNKALIAQLSSIKTDGLRDADVTDYNKKYQDYKNTYINAMNLPNNSRERLDALVDAQKKYQDVNDLIYRSKKGAEADHEISSHLLTNPHLFSDDAHAQFLKSMQSPLSSTDRLTDYNGLERYVDPAKQEAQFNKIVSEQHRSAQWSNPIQVQGRDKQGNKTGVVVYNQKVTTPEAIAAGFDGYTRLNPDAQKYLHDRYPSIQGGSDDETRTLRIAQLQKDLGYEKGYVEKSQPSFKADWRPRVAVNNNYYGGAAPIALNVPMVNEDGKQVGSFHSPNYLPINKPNVNLAGIQSINLQTGQPESPLKSSNKYNIVGITSVPTLRIAQVAGNKQIPAGSVVQADYAAKHPNLVSWKDMAHVQEQEVDDFGKTRNVDHLVDRNVLPRNVTGTKQWHQQTEAYRPYGGQQTSLNNPAPKPQATSPTQSYKAKNGQNYTHKQLLDLGYTEKAIQKAIEFGNLK